MIKLCIETIDPSKLTSPLISIFNGMAALQVGELIKTRYVMHAKWLCISPERVCTSMIYMRWESHFYSNDVVGHVPLAAIAEKRKLNKMSSCLRLETPWLSCEIIMIRKQWRYRKNASITCYTTSQFSVIFRRRIPQWGTLCHTCVLHWGTHLVNRKKSSKGLLSAT